MNKPFISYMMTGIFIFFIIIYFIYHFIFSSKNIPLDYLVDYMNIKDGATMDFRIHISGISGTCTLTGDYDGNTYNITSQGDMAKCINFNQGDEEALNAISLGENHNGRRKSRYFRD
jgi:hypothetical protein